MGTERLSAASFRFLKLAQQFHDKEFRDSYVAAHTRRFLARQMRKFRGDLSQTEFAEQLDKQQTIVSRLENPNYSGWTLGTLLEIASKLNVGVVVRFVDFPTFLKSTDDFSERAMHPTSYDPQRVDNFARSEAEKEFWAAPQIAASDLIKALEILRTKVDAGSQTARAAQSDSMMRGLTGAKRENFLGNTPTPWFNKNAISDVNAPSVS